MSTQKMVALATPIPLHLVDGAINWDMQKVLLCKRLALDPPLDMCCICQKPGGNLRCPAKNPNLSMRNVGYNLFSANIESLKGTNHVFPSGRKPENFDESSGVKETLIKHEAKFHCKCHLNYTTHFTQEPAQPTSNNTSQQDKPSVRTRSSSVSINPKEEVCFLCKKASLNKQPLHCCMTYEIFNSIKNYGTKANDTAVLAFLAEGDLVAQEAKYHSTCVLTLLAFADLLLYMHEQLEQNGKNCAFNTSTLIKLYNDRLSQLLGEEQPLSDVHNSRFRERILLHLPDLQASKVGREYLLTVKNANILKNLDVSNDVLDALAVNRFIRNLRSTVTSTNITFSGSFAENCEEKCIPPSLLALVNMLLYGPTILSECRASQPAISISQLIMANMLKRRPSGDIVRLNKTQEPPLPLYVGLSIFGSSRDKSLIDSLHRRGLSVSSNRIYELTGNLARTVVQRAEEEGVRGFFTVGALDNIDVKPSSTTSQGEFHGTGISLFQLPFNGEVSTARNFTTTFQEAAKSGSRRVPKLPDTYSEAPDFDLKNPKPTPPLDSSEICDCITQLTGTEEFWHGERDWLLNVHDQLKGNDHLAHEITSWAAFRAERQPVCPLALSNNSLLPLFEQKSATPKMVKHGMDLLKSTTDFLNYGQTPVLCVDQPLFAIAKAIQRKHPEEYGDKQFLILFGPLHIEQNFLRVLGEVTEGSGWTGIVAGSGILPSGSAEGLLKVFSITKSRLFHQYTAAVLFSLLKDAYCHDHPECDVTIETWIQESASKSPTFKYWLLVLRLELLLLKFVRSVREAQFENFKESVILMLPWFFLSGHHLYARWLTVHAADLLSLEGNAPELHRRMSMGAFVVRKSLNGFSALGVDHAHEQNNADIKSREGPLGLTQDLSSLRRWTIAGPEVTHLLSEFEEKLDQKPGPHHEQYPKFQWRFFENCIALKDSFLRSENPFLVRNRDLINLDTGVEFGEQGIASLNILENRGVEMLKEFLEKRLQTHEIPFHSPVKQHKIEIFTCKKNSKPSAVLQLKCDVQLFSRLFIVSLARELDLKQFFERENQLCPPALSSPNGGLRSGDKSNKLVTILEGLSEDGAPQACDGIVLDAPAILRMVTPQEETASFFDYSKQISKYCVDIASKMNCKRVDIVWDQYSEMSIKTTTRTSRGTGARRPGLPQKGPFPKRLKQWEDYLRNAANKSELFTYLAEMALKTEKLTIVTNVNDTIKVSRVNPKDSSLDNVSCALMEEADGRIFLHAQEMVLHGAKCLLLRCSDTDIRYRSSMTCNRKDFNNYGYITLGEDRSAALRGFHAFTGCDTVSFFAGKGKRSAWAAWDQNDDVTTNTFKVLGQPNKAPPDHILPVLEHFVVALYEVEDTCEK
ncbi:Potassium channel GORK [Frankliniella fusca]|uniref:Potassium channel GORK n=1 Tax=Frankliniella fusca TaxID=407009 RepID=A0AAE1H907_9NEOP|nr:Potassium channel GORK [Frankliniella fusca]